MGKSDGPAVPREVYEVVVGTAIRHPTRATRGVEDHVLRSDAHPTTVSLAHRAHAGPVLAHGRLTGFGEEVGMAPNLSEVSRAEHDASHVETDRHVEVSEAHDGEVAAAYCLDRERTRPGAI